MEKQQQQQKARADWIKTYQQLGSISNVGARNYGIARSTLQRWLIRLPQEGLADRSRRPQKLARQKLDDETINLLLDIRDVYRFGKIRICSHLLQHHQISISPSTIAGVLEKYDHKLLKRYIGSYLNLNVLPKTFRGKGSDGGLQNKHGHLSVYRY